MKYIFLHIPKNGGTTLDHILDSQYKKNQVFNIAESKRKEKLEELKQKNYFSKKRIKIVKGGHFAFGIHEYFNNPENIKYFTILRHPLQRAVSYYYFVKAQPAHYLHDALKDMTFEDFLDRDDLNFEICNGQTKLIAGLTQKNVCDNAVFETAKKHLENNYFQVGILEHYVETLYFLKQQLNWKKPIKYTILNANTHKRNQMSTAIEDKILSLNSFDLEIYNTYLKQLKTRIENANAKDFETFKKRLG